MINLIFFLPTFNYGGAGNSIFRLCKNLNKKKFVFKKEIAKKLNLRFVPDLSFSFDNTFEYANKIEKILNEPKVLKDL